jgi:glutaconate CoA-transferase subunit B
VEAEVDMVCSVGYNPAREIEGMRAFTDLRAIVTDLCVMDFEGPNHGVRVRSLHPGVSFDEVQAATGFPLLQADGIATTAAPGAEELQIVRALDPHNLRAAILRDNPAPRRA